jgi:hypothetical protein
MGRPILPGIRVVLSPCCLPVATMSPAMAHHDEFLDNDERPRSRRFAAGVVDVAPELRE